MNKKLFFLSLCLLHNNLVSQSTVLIFGGERGWIGKKLMFIFKQRGYNAFAAKSRLENRESIEKEITTLKPHYIINSAGVTGKPNIDWCETHKKETIRSNVLGAINLADVAFIHGIHITNIATGCIYKYDDNHPLGSGIGFSESDEPNFSGSFYSQTKIMVEKLLLCYSNVLNLRVRMPISSDLSSKSFIGKILKHKKLINIPNSMTVLDDLLPLIPKMLEMHLVGNFNFVNSGAVSHNEIMSLYQKYIDPNHKYENFSEEEMNKILRAPRSNCELDNSKLRKLFPDILHVKLSLIQILSSKKANECNK